MSEGPGMQCLLFFNRFSEITPGNLKLQIPNRFAFGTSLLLSLKPQTSNLKPFNPITR